jgi:hypothetical protein
VTGDHARRPDVGALASAAVRESGGGFEVERLVAFLSATSRAARRAGRLPKAELSRCRRDGTWAAESGQQLPAVVDAYLSGARLLWIELASQAPSGRGGARLTDMGASIFRAVDDALAQVAAGFGDARRIMVRRDEQQRRDFIDDLLGGRGEISVLLARAENHGLLATAEHCVIVLGPGHPATDVSGSVSGLETSLRARVGGRGLLVASRHGRVVVVLQSAGAGTEVRAPEVERLATTLLAAAGRLSGGRDRATVSVSRCRRGLAGIARCFREADEGYALIGALGWHGRIVYADELAVFRVLLRDQESMIELVESVLEPLRSARGGAQPLLETLHVFFSCGAVATESARRLHLSVRAVSYRLARVRTLTGYDPANAEHRLTLHVAVTGARLLGWS